MAYGRDRDCGITGVLNVVARSESVDNAFTNRLATNTNWLIPAHALCACV